MAMDNIHSQIAKDLALVIGSDRVFDRSKQFLQSIEVHPESLYDSIAFFKKRPYEASYLDSITGIDLLTYPGPEIQRKDVPWSAWYGNEDKVRLYMLVYQLVSLEHNREYIVKTVLYGNIPSVASIDSLYGNANWLEREIYDLLGIDFLNSRDLRRIMLPEDWEGSPLRKDYKEGEKYNGMLTTRFNPLEAMKQRGISLKNSILKDKNE